MKRTHCCQCGAPRVPSRAPVQSFSRHDILTMENYREIAHPPGVYNEQSPQLMATFSLYRNGGTNEDTHLCDGCIVVGLKHLRERIDADLNVFKANGVASTRTDAIGGKWSPRTWKSRLFK